jgi:cytochrome c oxidase subunit 2
VQATVPVTPAAGKTVFTGPGGCGSCHTLAAAGTTGTVGPNLTTRLASDCANPASQKIRGATLQKCIQIAIVNPYAFIPSGYTAGVMPNTFSKTLSKSQVAALVAFLASVTH